jgi:hypothetical protein
VHKTPLLIAGAFFALAAVILVFADGARRFYAGGLFVVLGIVTLVNAIRSMQSHH